jgi:DNA polymerase-3 subunit alpha
MAALLTSVGDSKDKMAVYLNECRRMGIKVLPPDVSESIRYFAAVGEDIRFGLGAVRNVGERRRRHRQARDERILLVPRLPRHGAAARRQQAHGRVAHQGRRVRLDGRHRRALLEIHEDAVEAAVDRKRNEAQGDRLRLRQPLRRGRGACRRRCRRPEWTKKDKLAFEREMLGLYVSDHPLAGLEIPLAKHASTSIHDLLASEDVNDGDIVTVAGLVTSVQHRVAKQSGNPYGMITVEDFDGE